MASPFSSVVPTATRFGNRPKTVEEAFDPRSNAIGFMRWLMAFLVIFSHSGPIGGYYGGKDLGTQISAEQSLGGIAVSGFFFFSGFLITKSRMGRSSIFRYFWRRCLRIMPAFWTALLLTVVVIAPISYYYTHGEINGYLHPAKESPFTYFINNMFLDLHQRNIAGMGVGLPYETNLGSYDWNGSAWTLLYEFKAYIIVGFLGLFGVLTHRRITALIAFGMIALNSLQWMGAGNLPAMNPTFGNIFNLLLLAPFFFGMIFALYGDKIPVDDRLMVLAVIFALYTYDAGGWNSFGQYAFCYVLMWMAVRLPLTNWEKFGDFSYGIYIFAWPLMTMAAHFGLNNYNWFVYHLVIVIACHMVAFVSWHLIEKPAMSLKNWTPKWMTKLIEALRPLNEKIKNLIVVPPYSSTRWAVKMLEKEAAEVAEKNENTNETTSPETTSAPEVAGKEKSDAPPSAENSVVKGAENG